MVNPSIEQHWRRNLEEMYRRDPVGAAALALQFLFTGSPFSDIRTLTGRRDSTMAGATTTLIDAAEGSPATTTFPKIPAGQIFILDDVDTRVDDNAGGTPNDAVLANLSVQVLVNSKQIRELPPFTIDQYFCGKFGAIKKRMILNPGDRLTVKLVEGTSGGQSYDAFISLVGRLEPKWLFQIAYLFPMDPEQPRAGA